MRLPKNLLVVVADGARHLWLEPDTEAGPHALRVVDVEERAVARTSEQGAERPGRFPGPGARRETVEQTDWRRLAKEDFAHALADELAAAGDRPIALIAEPRTLGTLRAALAPAVAARVHVEIAADLARHTVPEIEQALMNA